MTRSKKKNKGKEDSRGKGVGVLLYKWSSGMIALMRGPLSTDQKEECQPCTCLVGEKPRQGEQQVQNSRDKSNKKTDLARAVYVREKMGDSIGDGEGDHLWPSLPL